MLILVLKRFRHDHTFGAGKVSTRVAFPLEELDMGPFLVRGMAAIQASIHARALWACSPR